MQRVLTPDYQQRLEEERDRWLRKRYRLYYTLATILWIVASLVLGQSWAMIESKSAQDAALFGIAFSMFASLLCAYPMAYIQRRRPPSSRSLLRVSYVVTTLQAALLIFPAIAVGRVITETLQARGRPGAGIGPMLPWALGFATLHSLASAMLPWRPLQALRAYIVFPLVLTIPILLWSEDSLEFAIVGMAVFWLIPLPGMAIAAFRHSRFASRFRVRALSEHVAETTQELTDARRLHDALFPAPIEDGPIRLALAYEPMRAIGGDFVYVHRAPNASDAPVSVVLIDVTGHGIAAALTVHRLHGELERLFGEDPGASPGFIIARLNSYLHVALAKHSVYATAIALRAGVARGEEGASLEFASAGHPPALLRRGATASVERLGSTTFVLGAVTPDVFDPAPTSHWLEPGDRVTLYTDGATESREAGAGMLGVEGLAALARDATDPVALLRAVRKRRAGPPTDDTLVVELTVRSS